MTDIPAADPGTTELQFASGSTFDVYEKARDRFVQQATMAGCEMFSYSMPQAFACHHEPLTIDVAVCHPESAGACVILSGGLHGVEAPFGSAVQDSVLRRLASGKPAKQKLGWVLLHCLNPFGFAWSRRVNEGNIDLNRNFLVQNQEYSGCPEGYKQLNELLNPSQEDQLHGFKQKILAEISKLSLPVVKQAVAGGQYEFPQGLFFGGSERSFLFQLLDQELPKWLGGVRTALHLDFHTGLGASGTFKLLLDSRPSAAEFQKFLAAFPPDAIQELVPAGSIAYQVSGFIGTWARQRLQHVLFQTMGVEFGTFDEITVLEALVGENWAHHHAPPGSAAWAGHKRRLAEVFCPRDPFWRVKTLQQAAGIIEQAMTALEVD